MKRQELILSMMMFGKFRSNRAKRDKDGKTIKDKKGKNILEKCWVYHNELNGDPGVFPSVNRIYQRAQGGRQKLTKAAENLFDRWVAEASGWVEDNSWVITDDKVILEIDVFFPNDNRKRDTHNALKLMMDAFENVIYTNDSKALPRIMNYQKIEDGEYPHFKLNIYRQDEEDEIMRKRYATTPA